MPEFIGMHEFSSTLTNLVFVIVGVIIYRRARFTGVATAILGIASAGWHWTMAPFWHTADLVMMYFMLLSLIDFSTGEQNTRWAVGVGVAMIGIHFLIPSHTIIACFAALLFLALTRIYPFRRIAMIVGIFLLWISTNIPYLHQWDVAFWKLDILHGISHISAAIGIYMTVIYKPLTFNELIDGFKSRHLPTLGDKIRVRYEQIIDMDLMPHLGDRPVEAILEQDVEQLHEDLRARGGSRFKATVQELEESLYQIRQYARGRKVTV